MTAALPVSGIHHVKIPVANLLRSREWYEPLLGLTAELEFRDADGTVRGVAYEPLGGVALALREDPDRAAALRGWDPVAFAVPTRADLDEVVRELDRRGVPHADVIRASLGWMLAATGPDDQQVRFYTVERHA